MATCPRPSPGRAPRHTNKAIGMWCRAGAGQLGSCQVSKKINCGRPQLLEGVSRESGPNRISPRECNTFVHTHTHQHIPCLEDSSIVFEKES